VVKLPDGKPEKFQAGTGTVTQLYVAPGGRVVYQRNDSGALAVYRADAGGRAPTLVAGGTIIATNLYR
jgi:hypothetical protein